MDVSIPFQRVTKAEVAWLGQDPIPAKPYYDPEYFELERKAVFLRSWLQIGHVCELPAPGSFIRREVEVAKASVLIVSPRRARERLRVIVRGKDAEIRAFHNVCTHRGTILVAAEAGRQSSFICPYHRWNFSSEGALVAAPDFDQFYVAKADCGLPRIALEICAGLIFINFAEAPAQTLREWLGPLAARLEAMPVARAVAFTEYAYEIDANWKLAFDNFQENYHLRFIHPLSSGAGVGQDNPFGYPERYSFHGRHRSAAFWANPDPGPAAPAQAIAFERAFASLAQDGIFPAADGTDEYFALFPNLYLWGSPLMHYTHMTMPISANKMRGLIRFYWVSEDKTASERFAREYTVASVRDVQCEDRAVIALGQRGLESGALKHIHFQAQESLCRHLYLQVEAMVQDYLAEQRAAAPPA